MNKSTNFSGMPIIKQVLNLINISDIYRTANCHNSDKYYKYFKTYDHLVTMIFAVISGCTSLREVEGIMLACEGKLNHLGLNRFPKRSTLSDANKKRNSEVFADIYYTIYKKYKRFLSDSSITVPSIKNLYIIDSTTITLFSEILKAAGRPPKSGKKKGGVKVHTMINALEDVPCLIRMTSSACNDTIFLKSLELKTGSFITFDRGYNDYSKLKQWDEQGIYFVSRERANSYSHSVHEFDIEDNEDSRVLKDEEIIAGRKEKQIFLRRIAYWVEEQKKVYVFWTNNFELSAKKIADIYENRWQIEVLFKRLKQNFPLKYFFGDNENAIKIQIWISLIAQLLMLIIQRKVKEKKWAYSNMVSIIRYHLMTYIDLFKFLNNPNGTWDSLTTKSSDQMLLFD